MSFCAKCGVKMPDDARFCPKCGSPVSTANDSFETTDAGAKQYTSSQMQKKTDDATKLAEIVRQLQSGHKEYFDQFYQMTSQIVMFNIRQYMRSENDVEDVMQVVYIKALQNIDSLTDPMKAFGWIKTIAVRTAMKTSGNKFARHESLVDVSSNADNDMDSDDMLDMAQADQIISSPIEIPEDHMDQLETQRLIGDIIQNLPANQASAITSFYYDELSVKDISEMTGRSEASVKMDLCRGRKTIKEKVVELAEKYDTKLYAIPAAPVLAAAVGMLISKMDTHAAEAGVLQAVKTGVPVAQVGTSAQTANGSQNMTVHGENPNGTEGIGRLDGQSGTGSTSHQTAGQTGHGTASQKAAHETGSATRRSVARNGAKAAKHGTRAAGSGAKAAGVGLKAAGTGAKAAGGWAALSTGVKATVFATVFAGAVAGTVGVSAATGHISQPRQEVQQKSQKENKKNTSAEDPLAKEKAEASKKTADEAYQEFLHSDPTITGMKDNIVYAEENIDGYSYGPLLFVFPVYYEENVDGPTVEGISVYYYNNGDYGNENIGKVVQITKQDTDAFQNNPNLSDAAQKALDTLNEIHCFDKPSPNDVIGPSEDLSCHGYDETTHTFLAFTGSDFFTECYYGFSMGKDGTPALKLERMVCCEVKDNNGVIYDEKLYEYLEDGTIKQVDDYPETAGMDLKKL